MNIELTGTKNGHGNILRTMDWENAEGQQLRVIMKNGEPWFCLKDVCSILSIENQGNVASRLDQRGIHQTDTLTSGGTQQLNYVDEPNLYRVIFRSDKPDAKKFQDWVFGTVLPSIRKTGSYLSQEDRRKVELWDYQNRGNIARAKLQYLITEKFGNMKNFAFMIRCSYSETRRTVSGYCYNERVCKAVKTWFGVDVQYEYTGKRMFEELESISQKIQSSRYLEGENEAGVVQYELVVVNSDTHDSKLEAGISALMLTMRNKYGICASMHYVLKAIEDCGVFRTVSKDSNSMLELRKVPEEKVQARKQAKAKLENAERMLRKYRAWYDRFLLSGDRESGAICEVYCHKLYRAVQDGYKAWLGVIA